MANKTRGKRWRGRYGVRTVPRHWLLARHGNGPEIFLRSSCERCGVHSLRRRLPPDPPLSGFHTRSPASSPPQAYAAALASLPSPRSPAPPPARPASLPPSASPSQLSPLKGAAPPAPTRLCRPPRRPSSLQSSPRIRDHHFPSSICASPVVIHHVPQMTVDPRWAMPAKRAPWRGHRARARHEPPRRRRHPMRPRPPRQCQAYPRARRRRRHTARGASPAAEVEADDQQRQATESDDKRGEEWSLTSFSRWMQFCSRLSRNL